MFYVTKLDNLTSWKTYTIEFFIDYEDIINNRVFSHRGNRITW